MADKHRGKATIDAKNPMPAAAFRDWRKRLGLKQKEAADLLGLKKRMIQYYETGNRGGKDVCIPKSIRLACYALEAGILDYNGEQVIEGPARPNNVRRLIVEGDTSNSEHEPIGFGVDLGRTAPNRDTPTD